MMFRLSMVMVSVLLFTNTADANTPGIDRSTTKEPHEWSVEDRLAARLDTELARARVARDERERSVRARPSSPVSLRLTRPSVDVIHGRLNPELFLPTELFDSLIRRGFLGVAAWREIHSRDIVAAGLPPTFWEELADVAAPMIATVRQQHAALRSIKENESLRDEVERQIAGDHAMLCRERATALREARTRFGPALDRFLYYYIARGESVSTNEPWNSNMLRQGEEGCP